MSTSPNPILSLAIRWGALFALALGVVASVVGWFIAGPAGLWAGVLGAGLAFGFLALTAASILLGQRLTVGDPGSPLFFGVVLGAWFLKLIVFVALLIWLRGQDWVDPYVFFGTVLVAVLGSLALDVLAFQKARVPYVDVELPGEQEPGDGNRD